MKKYLFVIILLSSLTVYCQSSIQTNYCLPLSKARLLFEDAVKKKVLDSIVHYQGKKIEILQHQNAQTYTAFNELLSIEKEKSETQKENTAHMERLALSYKSERDYYIKRERKQRRKKNILSYGLLVLLGIIFVK